MLEGRDFKETDDANHAHVAIVDDTLAANAWPGQSAIGKKLSIEDSPSGPFRFIRESVEVVGVVKHLQTHSLVSKGREQIYVPEPLAPRPATAFVVRTKAPMETFAAYVRQAVKSLDKDMAVANLRSEQEYVDLARAQTRFVTILATGLGGLALLIACIGIYGVTSYSVTLRKREIAIRLVVGARFADVRRMVLLQSGLPVAVGLCAGLVLSAVLTPLMHGMLFGVRPNDPLTFAAISLILGMVGVAACYVPASRASNIDPIVALRSE